MYLGGLGPPLEGESGEHNNGQRLASFTGCIARLELNSLGPLNLVRGDQLSRVEEARNLEGCDSSVQAVEEHLVSVSGTLGSGIESAKLPANQPTTEAGPSADLDDPDET